jgi:hypothetical protein
MILTTGLIAYARAQCYRTFVVVIYKCSQKACVFVNNKPLQPCLMSVGEASCFHGVGYTLTHKR